MCGAPLRDSGVLEFVCGTLLRDSGAFEAGNVSLQLGSGVQVIDYGTSGLDGVSFRIGSVSCEFVENRAGQG